MGYDIAPPYLKRTSPPQVIDPMVQTAPVTEARPDGFNQHPQERKKLLGERGQ